MASRKTSGTQLQSQQQSSVLHAYLDRLPIEYYQDLARWTKQQQQMAVAAEADANHTTLSSSSSRTEKVPAVARTPSVLHASATTSKKRSRQESTTSPSSSRNKRLAPTTHEEGSSTSSCLNNSEAVPPQPNSSPNEVLLANPSSSSVAASSRSWLQEQDETFLASEQQQKTDPCEDNDDTTAMKARERAAATKRFLQFCNGTATMAVEQSTTNPLIPSPLIIPRPFPSLFVKSCVLFNSGDAEQRRGRRVMRDSDCSYTTDPSQSYFFQECFARFDVGRTTSTPLAEEEEEQRNSSAAAVTPTLASAATEPQNGALSPTLELVDCGKGALSVTNHHKSWGRNILMDEEEDEPLAAAPSSVSGANSGSTSSEESPAAQPKHLAGAFLSIPPPFSTQTAVTTAGETFPSKPRQQQRSADVLLFFLHEWLQELWAAQHPNPDFSTEADRAAKFPLYLRSSLMYLAQLASTSSTSSNDLGRQLAASGTTIAAAQQLMLPLSSRYTPPFFPSSSFSLETNRLKKWLRTWRIAACGGAPELLDSTPAGTPSPSTAALLSAQASSSSFSLSHLLNFMDRVSSPTTTAEPSSTTSPTSSANGGDEEGSLPSGGTTTTSALESLTFLYDSRGNRLSARIARKEALQKEAEERQERARQQQRGYFSNDTSDMGSTSTAGGVGAHGNIAVLSGPVGIGKTAAVMQAAQALGYRVVEINPSVRRTPKMIEKVIAEATQSKQIHKPPGNTASGREELQRMKEESTRLAMLQAAEAAKLAAEAKRKEEAAAAEAKRLLKKQSGIVKQNAISKESISNFFKPKPKPVAAAVAVDVDAPEPKDPNIVVEVLDDAPDLPVQQNGAKASGGGSAAMVIDLVAERSPSPPPPPPPPPVMPLVLIESADVVLDDESAKCLYAAVKQMASESKFPIIVTANHMSRQQAATAFGAGTPHASMEPPTVLEVCLQGFLVALVECGVVGLAPHSSFTRSPSSSMALEDRLVFFPSSGNRHANQGNAEEDEEVEDGDEGRELQRVLHLIKCTVQQTLQMQQEVSRECLYQEEAFSLRGQWNMNQVTTDLEPFEHSSTRSSTTAGAAQDVHPFSNPHSALTEQQQLQKKQDVDIRRFLNDLQLTLLPLPPLIETLRSTKKRPSSNGFPDGTTHQNIVAAHGGQYETLPHHSSTAVMQLFAGLADRALTARNHILGERLPCFPSARLFWDLEPPPPPPPAKPIPATPALDDSASKKKGKAAATASSSSSSAAATPTENIVEGKSSPSNHNNVLLRLTGRPPPRNDSADYTSTSNSEEPNSSSSSSTNAPRECYFEEFVDLRSNPDACLGRTQLQWFEDCVSLPFTPVDYRIGNYRLPQSPSSSNGAFPSRSHSQTQFQGGLSSSPSSTNASLFSSSSSLLSPSSHATDLHSNHHNHHHGGSEERGGAPPPAAAPEEDLLPAEEFALTALLPSNGCEGGVLSGAVEREVALQRYVEMQVTAKARAFCTKQYATKGVLDLMDLLSFQRKIPAVTSSRGK